MHLADSVLADSDSQVAVFTAIQLALICLAIGGALALFIGLRNADIWWLQQTGVKTSGTVSRLEVSTGVQETTRRPYVTFATADGAVVEAASALYRKNVDLKVGDPVRLSYRAGNPKKIAIHGYDFRVREPLGSLVGVIVAVASVIVAVNL